jgi:hypothetical protein
VTNLEVKKVERAGKGILLQKAQQIVIMNKVERAGKVVLLQKA